ncbi:MAG TPA: hypothetical protein VHC69_24110 [Polyangiaceae bacterium]|nr:hypothetical protein [Polyangiaceae bacterium]
MSPRRRADPALGAAILLFFAHAALVLHFTPRGFLSMPAPFLTSAFALEAYRADRALRAFAATGHFSTYDPRVLAGQLAGMWEPFGTRALVILALVASRAHVGFVRAFGALVVSLHVLVPVVGYFAARAFGGTRSVAAAVLATWSLLTFGDALTHYAWFSGRIQFVAASALVVAQAAFADRALAEGRFRSAAVAVVAGVACVLLHPLPALLGAATVVVAVLRRRAAAKWLRGAVAASAFPALAVLAFAVLRGAASSEPLVSVFRTGPSSVFWDLVEVPGPGYGAAGSSRTLLRALCIGAGALGWIRSRRAFGALGLLALGAIAVAYLGSTSPLAWPVDPYFFAIPAAFAASLPATELLRSVQWRSLLRRGPVDARVALLVAAAIALPRVARTALTYAPELLPARHVRGPDDVAVSSLGGIDEPFPDPLGYDPAPPALPSLAAYLAREDRRGGRVLTDDAGVAGYLSLYTSLEVLGPLGERGAPSASADPTALLEGRPGAGGVAEFIERYGVAFVVLAGRPGPFDANERLFERAADVGGYRVRRVLRTSSLVLQGTAKVDSTAPGSLRVSAAVGPRVTLRYNYVPGLACRPACVVERGPSGAIARGFVSVANPPAAFEIFLP